MRPNAQQLAMRDPAAAALLGLIATADFGHEAVPSHFGGESVFGADFGVFGDFVDPYGADFGDEGFGDDFGDDFGADFGAAAAALATKPSPQAMAQTFLKAKAKAQKTAKRKSLLEPNAGSATKIERYSFTISQAFVIGTPLAFNISGSPDVAIRPQRFVVNSMAPGFITLTSVRVANVTVTVGPGTEDSWDYNALAVGTILDLPTLTPQNRATIVGNYTGFTPPGYTGGAAFTGTFSFKGWAEIVA